MTLAALAVWVALVHVDVRRWREALPLAKGGALALAVAAALSSGLWLAALDLASRSSRRELAEAVRTYWSVHPAALLETLAAGIPGRLPLAPPWRQALFESREPFLASLYLGLPAAGLVAAAFAVPGVGKRRRFALAGLGLAAVAVALGRHTPFFGLVVGPRAASSRAALPGQDHGSRGLRLGRPGRLRRGRVAARRARAPVVARGRAPTGSERGPGRRRRPLAPGGAAAVAGAARRGHRVPGRRAAPGARARSRGHPRVARHGPRRLARALRAPREGPRRGGGGRGRRRPRPRAPPAQPGGARGTVPAPTRGPRRARRPGFGPRLLVRLQRVGTGREVARPARRARAGARSRRVAARPRQRARPADEPGAADAGPLGTAAGLRHRLPGPAGESALPPDPARAPGGGPAGRGAAGRCRSGRSRT